MINSAIHRLATKSDKNAILKLLNGVFKEQQMSSSIRDDKFWNWKYENNPFGESLLTVSEYKDEVIAVGNMWPWKFETRCQIINALQPCDAAVNPEFRGKGLFRKLRIYGVELARENKIDLLFNFPNNNSLSSNLSLGWDYNGRIKWYVKILKPLHLLSEKIKKSEEQFFEQPPKYNVDADFLDTISNNSTSFDGYFKIHRCSGFHKWRYVDHPTRIYGMINHQNQNNDSAAIFTVNLNNAIREMVIVDLIGSVKNIKILMKCVVTAAKEMNIDFIAIMENKKFETNLLWQLGFIPKKFKNMVTLPLNQSFEKRSDKFENWSLVAGMHDSI